MASYWKTVKCDECGEPALLPKRYPRPFRCDECESAAVTRAMWSGRKGPPLYVTRG